MENKAVSVERIEITGQTEGNLATLVKSSFDRALVFDGKIPKELLELHGMSGKKYRFFINNLVGDIIDARYLEIGSWAGSTLCSAIFGNKVKALAIDNWSEFGGPAAKFFTNIGTFVSASNSVSIITSDFRNVSYQHIGHFNVFLYDGPHAQQDQYDGLHLALSALDEEFVFIVDDWNWDYVRAGTFEAIKDNRCEIVYSLEVFSTENNMHPNEIGLQSEHNSDWHNGYFISVVRKNMS